MMLKVHVCVCVCGEGGVMLKSFTAIFQLLFFFHNFSLGVLISTKRHWFGLKVAGKN